jgi:adenylate cyclase
MLPETPGTVEVALADVERKGFRLAVIGRTCALVAISIFYAVGAPYPSNIYIAGLILTSVALGLAVLGSAASRYERLGRYAVFAFDAAAISAALAFAPLSARRWPMDLPGQDL